MFDEQESVTRNQEPTALQYSREDVIYFEDGLIGHEDCKSFVIIENGDIAPIYILQSVDQRDVRCMVLDSKVVFSDYNQIVPAEEWLRAGVTEPSAQLSLLTIVLGTTPQDSSANLRAPVLINFQEMTGRHIALADARLPVRYPLVSVEDTAVKAVAAQA